ncbi:MAG: YebC/PmpR family DNA-binding transcriptional regulator [Bdellovibrionaceae bacterium]|nr:YebC/PmpR family DNA-binding transcriptional regulator [Pseudobdellovibrionaceae bacterium]
MGKGWKTSIKVANAQKKGMAFTKLAREIQVAAKAGGADPQMNSRLRLAIDAAKKASCPVDTIERAIKKGSGQGHEGALVEEVTYEGYGPNGVGVIVECQTDNRNRTVPEIRQIFKSHGGHLGELGSVAWMFKRVSLIEAHKAGTFDPDEEAIEAGADEVEQSEDSFLFYGSPDSGDEIRKALQVRGWIVTKAELAYKPTNPTTLTPEQHKVVEDFLSELDDYDDSHRVYATLS